MYKPFQWKIVIYVFALFTIWMCRWFGEMNMIYKFSIRVKASNPHLDEYKKYMEDNFSYM